MGRPETLSDPLSIEKEMSTIESSATFCMFRGVRVFIAKSHP